MNDRELLELAAKAAGYDVQPHVNAKVFRELQFSYKGKNWNPLTNDGDALRLAVKLALDVSVADASSDVVAWDRKHNACFEDLGNDPYAATRRAIVRAAAEIGKAM